MEIQSKVEFEFWYFSWLCNYVPPYVFGFFLAHHPSVCPRNFDIPHNFLWDLVDLLSFSIKCYNQLKWKYAPQSSLHYTFICDTWYFSRVLPKTENNFLNYCIPVGSTMGSSRDVPNSIFSYWYPISLLPPISSNVGSDHTRLCGFCHALAIVSERHGIDGSTLASFFLFCLVRSADVVLIIYVLMVQSTPL